MPPSHITHTPGSNRSTPGIFHHANRTHAIIDLHERFGIDTPRMGRGRLLLHEEGSRHFAFLVDNVVGLVRSEQGSWANLPLYLPQELFSIGFLYQNEIVLCSELAHLRTMHDVEPLRRHFEQLQKQTQKQKQNDSYTSSDVEKAPTKKPTDQVDTKEITPEPSPVPLTQTELAAAPLPHTSEQPVVSVKQTTEQTASASTTAATQTESNTQRVTPSATPQPATTSHIGPPNTRTPSAAAEMSSSPPHAPRSKPAPPGDDNSLLWLILFLLFLGAIPLGYWLWPQPDRERLIPSVALKEPSPVTAVVETPEEVPLRIEKDGDGTINLIIDRTAIAIGRKTPAKEAPPLPDEEQQPSTTTEATSLPAKKEPAEEELEPTAVVQPEACDCTHIVVKGDTLWDIAERYTGNAFNYPELAKRSRIKNPHRIYPGDRVRIIIR